MVRRKIVLSFDKKGDLKMEAEGFPDGSCKLSIEKLRTLLGKEEPIEAIDKPEAYLESYEGYETTSY